MRAIRSVLVIDDNPDTRETLSAILCSLGCDNVVPVASAEEAGRVLQTERFSLMLVDYRLGGMNGADFVEQLRARGNFTPVILIPGVHDAPDLARARRQPRVDCFPKPFRVADLLVAVDRLAA